MVIVGLTGGVASGKSTVSHVFGEAGAHLIDVDQVARELLQPKTPSWRDVVQAFGTEILEKDGSIQRRKLRALVFSDPEVRKRLDGILHPRIKEEVRRRIEKIRQENPEAIVVIDAPLLVETGGHRETDEVVVVIATEAQQVERLKRRDGVSEEQARQILAAQMPVAEKAKVADFIIRNDGSPEETRQRAREVFQVLKRRATERQTHPAA